jgi:nitroimidazol reductase NimA-like FMN-containing flavoprotein (pyridoxamine 5'-phosphate oxidase superfamily)
MTPEIRQFVESLLASERDLTLATLRPDGSPQANTVSYASDGLCLYFGTGRDSEKVRNLQHCRTASIAIDAPYADWGAIKGVSMGGTATILPDDSPESRCAMELLACKFPNVDDVSPPPRLASIVFVKFVPNVISVLDYSKGFGHVDLVHVEAADFAR